MWLIRHAESTWNAAGRWQGQADPPLSPRGHEQAENLARRLAAKDFALLVTSDLRRASQTAAGLAKRLGLVARSEPRLREIEAGAWSGLTHAQIEALDAPALARFRSGDIDAPAGGGESRREAAARAREALIEIAREAAGREVAVVTHGGIVHALFPGVRLANTEWKVLELPAGFDSAAPFERACGSGA